MGNFIRRLLFGKSLERAIAYETACEEADDRFPGLYADQLDAARKEVRRLTAKCGYTRAASSQAPQPCTHDIADTVTATLKPCHRTSGAGLAPVPGSSPL